MTEAVIPQHKPDNPTDPQSDYRPSDAASRFRRTGTDCFHIRGDGKTLLVKPTRQTKAMVKALQALGKSKQEILDALMTGGAGHSSNTNGKQVAE